MLSPRWRKVLRDLWSNKRRTLLVVLSVAVGVFAVGTVAHMQVLISHDLVASYNEVNPASATIHTEAPFDEELVETVRRMPQVAEAEGRRSLVVRFRLNEEKGWYPLLLSAIPDCDDVSINVVHPERRYEPDPELWPDPGVWPPPERELVLERTSLLVPYLGLFPDAQQGDTIEVETPNGKQRTMRMAGLVYDYSRIPATFANMAYGYVTLDTLEWLGAGRTFDEMHILVSGDRQDEAHIQRVALKVENRIERNEVTVARTEIPEPGKLPLDSWFRAAVMILGVLGAFSLVLSGFLVINTISALMARQVRQIGMMKAIGARTGQIAGLYLGMVSIFGLLSLVVAMPLGSLTAREFVSVSAYFINFSLGEFRIPPQVMALEAAMGLLAPLLAALYPILAGARVTVHDAISSYGLGQEQFGAGAIDRLIERVRGLPRPLLLSLRNTFRRKGRLILTLATLTLAGAIFVSVVSVRASLLLTMEELLRYWRFDVQVNFARPYRTVAIEREVMGVPGVVALEGWGETSTYRVRPDGSEGSSIYLIAPPAETSMLKPIIVRGRWLLPEDENALVVTTHLLAEEPDLALGDEIALQIEGREATWRIVGVVQIAQAAPIAYANYSYFTRVTRDTGQASIINVATQKHDEAFQSQVMDALEKRFEQAGMHVRSVQSNARLREGVDVYFNIIVSLLMTMSVLLAIVGGLGLMGTMSLNVLERTREIGVMRAVGASSESVMLIFIFESIFIGLLSWLIGAILAFPLGKLLSDAVGARLLHANLSYAFSANGAIIWLALVTALAATAALLPARNGTRISVREALAYE